MLFFTSILHATFFVVVNVKKLFPICWPSPSIINVFTIISVLPFTNLVGKIIMGIKTVSFGFAVCILFLESILFHPTGNTASIEKFKEVLSWFTIFHSHPKVFET